MEWMLPVNEMLKDEITKLDYTLIPPGCQVNVPSRIRLIQESLGKIIDALGQQSSADQGLSKAITSAEKLRNAPTHVIYLLKDAAARNGAGEVIGYLKTAHKNLYLFDERDKVCQVAPLCVLDFYVNSSQQRRGNGRRLFDFMLQDTGNRPEDLPVDGPSKKMEQFLAKNYGLDRLIKQSNNFAIAPSFFATSPYASKPGNATPVIPTAAVGRYTARKPPTSISDVIHGASDRLYVNTNNGTGNAPEQSTPSPRQSPQQSPRHSPMPSPMQPLELAQPEPDTASPPASPTPGRPTSLSVAPAALSPAGSATPRRPSQITDKGYLDVKFYHSKLW